MILVQKTLVNTSGKNWEKRRLTNKSRTAYNESDKLNGGWTCGSKRHFGGGFSNHRRGISETEQKCSRLPDEISDGVCEAFPGNNESVHPVRLRSDRRPAEDSRYGRRALRRLPRRDRKRDGRSSFLSDGNLQQSRHQPLRRDAE